jgi:hypothetical protein
MNKKTAMMLREVAGVGNRQAYQALKREWSELSGPERTRRRAALKAAAAAPKEKAKKA